MQFMCVLHNYSLLQYTTAVVPQWTTGNLAARPRSARGLGRVRVGVWRVVASGGRRRGRQGGSGRRDGDGLSGPSSSS